MEARFASIKNDLALGRGLGQKPEPRPAGEATTTMQLLPPVLVLISLAAMIVLGIFVPGAVIVTYPYNLAGAALATLGLLVTLAGARHFDRIGTNIKTFDEPGVLVTDGPFRWSRNPMYVGFVLLLAGAGVLGGAATPFLVVALFAAITDRWYIRFEERALLRKFGEDYAAYVRRTRRWI